MIQLLLATSLLVAPSPPRDDDTLDRIQRDLGERMKTANAEKRDLKEEDVLPLVERCWKIYDENEGEPIEFDALVVAMRFSTQVASARLDEHWRDGLKKLTTQFRDDDRIAQFVLSLPVRPRLQKEADAALAELAQTTKNANVKAAFDYKKVQPLLQQSEMGDLPAEDEKRLVAQLQALGKAHPSELVPGERPPCTYEQFVTRTLFAIEHLKVGAIAPEIEGKDLDGVAFKISDYRGKVVLLDFWGYW